MKLKLLAGAASGCGLRRIRRPGGAGHRRMVRRSGPGYREQQEMKTTSSGLATFDNGRPFDYNISTDGDWLGFARLGYRFAPNWRAELEGGYRKGDIDRRPRRHRPHPAAAPLHRRRGPHRRGPDLRRARRARSTPTPAWPTSSMTSCPPAGSTRSWAPASACNRTKLEVLGQFDRVGAGQPVQNLSANDKDYTLAYQGIAGIEYRAARPPFARPDLSLPRRVRRPSTARSAPALQPGAIRGRLRRPVGDLRHPLRLRGRAAGPPAPAACRPRRPRRRRLRLRRLPRRPRPPPPPPPPPAAASAAGSGSA